MTFARSRYLTIQRASGTSPAFSLNAASWVAVRDSFTRWLAGSMAGAMALRIGVGVASGAAASMGMSPALVRSAGACRRINSATLLRLGLVIAWEG